MEQWKQEINTCGQVRHATAQGAPEEVPSLVSCGNQRGSLKGVVIDREGRYIRHICY